MAVRPTAVRPTKLWRARISDEAARVAVLERFEAEIVGAGAAPDEDVFKAGRPGPEQGQRGARRGIRPAEITDDWREW